MSRTWLAPFAPVYRAAVAAKNLGYERKWLKAKRLRNPVISVGNLSVGGAGKTPLTIRLAELLTAHGAGVDVLSRGYGRKSTATEEIDPMGNASRFGDEPLLIARRAKVPVFVGASRYQAGLLAEQQPAPDGDSMKIHLLDDGFQHRKLARNVDVVLVHSTDFAEKLLPSGRLREPITALKRASFLVLREEDSGLEARLRGRGIAAPIWWVRRSVDVPPSLSETTKRVVAFCGIARPDEFFSSVIAAGVNLEETISFADHHRYTRDDMERLARVAAKVSAEAFVITEKDAVKLDASLLQILEQIAPVSVATLSISLRDETAVLEQLWKALPGG